MDEFYDRFMALLSVHATDRPTITLADRRTGAEGESGGGATTEARGRGERGLINAIGKAKAADSTQAHPPYSNPSLRSSGIFFYSDDTIQRMHIKCQTE